MAQFVPLVLTTNSPTTGQRRRRWPSSITLEILPHGFTLHRVLVKVGGYTHDIVVGPEDPKDHVDQKYINSIIGRYTNRVPAGRHFLERKGIKSEMVALPNESPQVSLHGGPTGFDSVVWTHLSSGTSGSRLFSKAELDHFGSSSAVFRLVSSAGDQGYPGTLVVEALVAVIAPENEEEEDEEEEDELGSEVNVGSIVVVYRARLDEREREVTAVNLTQHWGFNLDASLPLSRETLTEGALSVKGHVLRLKADRLAELDSHGLYTGRVRTTSDHPEHDHCAGKRIGELFPQNGYDDYYLFSNPNPNPNSEATDHHDLRIPTRFPLSSFDREFDLLERVVQPLRKDVRRRNRPESVAELESDESGIRLMFDTNQRGVMFYTNNYASPGQGARKKIHGGSGINGYGDSYAFGSAAFLEFHEPFGAFLDPRNKDGEDTLLTSEEMYHNYVRCDISIRSGVLGE